MAVADPPSKGKQQLPVDFQFPDEADHYEVLGVSDAATATEIKKAYRLRCLEHHPDKHPERTYCKENFQRVGAAYDALSNEDLRKQYDHQRWSADMGVNVTSQQVQRFCMQHKGKRLDYVDMEPWVDKEVVQRFSAVQASMSKESGFMFLPSPTPGGQAGVYMASTSSEEIARVKTAIQRILSEFRGDTATSDGVTILLPPDLRRGLGALQQLRQNFQCVQLQTQVRMNTHMSDRVVLWGPLGGSRSQVDAVYRIQVLLEWRGVMIIWDAEADKDSKGGPRGKQVSPWEYLVSVEVACSSALTPSKLPPQGKADPAFEEVPTLIRRLLPDGALKGCSKPKSNVEADLLELLQVASDWLEATQKDAGPVLSRMLSLARSVEERRKRAEEAKEAQKRWEAEKKKRALQEAKARAMGLADQMLQAEAKEGNKDAIRILAEEFLRKEQEEDRKRAEEEAQRKAEKELARKMAEEARLKALEEANRRNQEMRERKRRAEELARKRIAEEVERRKAEEEAKLKAQKDDGRLSAMFSMYNDDACASSPSSATVAPPKSAGKGPSFSYAPSPSTSPQDTMGHTSSSWPGKPPGLNVQSGKGSACSSTKGSPEPNQHKAWSAAPSSCPQGPPGLNTQNGKGHSFSSAKGAPLQTGKGYTFSSAKGGPEQSGKGQSVYPAKGASESNMPKMGAAASSSFPADPPGLNLPKAGSSFKRVFPKGMNAAAGSGKSPESQASWSYTSSPAASTPKARNPTLEPTSPQKVPTPSPEQVAEAKRKAQEEAETKRKAQEDAEAKRRAQEQAEAQRKAQEEAEAEIMKELQAEAEKKRKAEQARREVEDICKKRQKLEEINKKALAEMKKRLLEEAEDMAREAKIKQSH